ncbi:MAG: hypothetical protein U9N59_00120 [Campylobacterota bacterium]|nr:hypothetical protein [Campylobacterota bacterium]
MKINTTKNYISPSNRKKSPSTREVSTDINKSKVSFSDKALRVYIEDLLQNDTKLARLEENDLDSMMMDSNSNFNRNPYAKYLKYLSADL